MLRSSSRTIVKSLVILLAASLLLSMSLLAAPAPPFPTATAVAAGAANTKAAENQAIVQFLDVGQGSAVLFHSGQNAILVDGGPTGAGLVRKLRSAGVTRLDLVIATHAHADHIGGLVEALEAFPVGEVWYNGQTYTTRTFEQFVDAIDASGARYREPVRGYTASFGPFRVDVLNPPRSAAHSQAPIHANMLVAKITVADLSVLVTGDLEKEQEYEILSSAAKTVLAATLVQLGHHGSRTSSSKQFLLAVRPRAAVYQAGAGNPYGHPHVETLSLLKQLRIPVWGTDRYGTISIFRSQSGYQIKGQTGEILVIDPTAKEGR